MPKILVAEDETILRQFLVKKLTTLWPKAEIVAQAADGLAALEVVAQHAPEVAFLDIHMPEMTGLEVAREIGDRCHVVFVTAYDQYAIEAFEKGAVDYLVKPVNDERLLKTIERLEERLAEPPTDLSGLVTEIREQLFASQGGSAVREPLTWIKASVGQSLKLVPVKDVLFFQSDEKYTRVVSPDGEVLIRKPMKELLEELDLKVFWQIHRNAIVAVTAIDKVTRDFKGEATVHIKGTKESLKVSRPFSHLFKQM